MAATSVVWVGVDVGKASHHAAAVDDDGRVLWSVKAAKGQKATETLLARALASADGADAELRWAIDLTNTPAASLTAVLLTAGQQVLYVPGRAVNSMAAVFRGEGKTDAKDARIIADTARMRHRDLTRITAPDELVVELTRLTARRTDLNADWVRGVNRPRELLTGIFPALEHAFDYSTRSALVLVTGFCTPGEISQTGAEDLAAHLANSGAWRKSNPTIEAKAIEAAAQQDLALPGELVTAMLVNRPASLSIRAPSDSARAMPSTNNHSPGRTSLKITCGIDWSEKHHDIALVDETGALVAKRRITESIEGFNELLTMLAEFGDAAEAPSPVAIETPRGGAPAPPTNCAPCCASTTRP